MTVGVLALQGESEAHREILDGLGHQGRPVRTAGELSEVSGLVLPGGESTTQTLLLKKYELVRPLLDFIHAGHPIMATCAGTILLARNVDSGPGLLGYLDIAVQRNGFGAQRSSFAWSCHGRRGMFIRAPRICAVGRDAEVLLRLGDEPIAVRQGSVVAATFHPELAGDPWLHEQAFGRASK